MWCWGRANFTNQRASKHGVQQGIHFPSNLDTYVSSSSSLSLQLRKEGNVLFNDALNTFYLRLYGVRQMVKDHLDSERGNPLSPHGLLFSINSKGSFICTIPDRITHTKAFVTPVVEHWLEREIAQWVHPMKDLYS